MADPKPKKKSKKTQGKPFEAQVDSFLDGLQIVPDGAKESHPEQAGRPEGAPESAPAVVSKLIDFIKKM
jgi:hypothetical protein